jgi:hypothetical protein
MGKNFREILKGRSDNFFSARAKLFRQKLLCYSEQSSATSSTILNRKENVT